MARCRWMFTWRLPPSGSVRPRWRSCLVGGVGIYRGDQLVHMAPPAARVPDLVNDLLTWLATSDWHPLLVSCVAHDELEFIHPFADGNGRLGRLWQTLILSRCNPLLAWLPIEEVIRSRQQGYYDNNHDPRSVIPAVSTPQCRHRRSVTASPSRSMKPGHQPSLPWLLDPYPALRYSDTADRHG
jgi:hypothetical protein